MAVTNTIKRNSIYIKLNNGFTEAGLVEIVTQSLGALKTSAFTQEDLQKALNIVDALRPVIALPVYKTELFVTSEFE